MATYEEQVAQLEEEKKAALNDVDVTYGNMIADASKQYQDQIDAVDDWEKKQSALQQEQTDFAIEQIEQKKEQTQKDYTKEQSAAYADWQKQSNKYGANAEAMAAAGLAGTGYSESSQVSMYNTYQNRVAVARETMQQAIVDYDNAMKDAQLQNNSMLAQIAYEALQSRLTLSLEGFQYQNDLISAQTSSKQSIEESYLDLLDQINKNNSLLMDKEPEKEPEEKYEVETDYWKGDLNPDAKEFGTFSNGYQPKGISGHGALTKSGEKVTFRTETLAGEERVSEQEIWVAEDGTTWRWEGRENKYIPCLTSDVGQGLRELFPDKIITDTDVWEALVAKYGEEYMEEYMIRRGWTYKPTYKSSGGGSGVASGGKSRTQLVNTLK